MAACKAVWNPKLQKPWYFLKEISSDGDLSTLDVIFPALVVREADVNINSGRSPFFIVQNASVLEAMFQPIFEYATLQVRVLRYCNIVMDLTIVGTVTVQLDLGASSSRSLPDRRSHFPGADAS